MSGAQKITIGGVITTGGVATTLAGRTAGGGTGGGNTNPRVLTFARVCQRVVSLKNALSQGAPRPAVLSILGVAEVLNLAARRCCAANDSFLDLDHLGRGRYGVPLRHRSKEYWQRRRQLARSSVRRHMITP